MDNIRRRKWWTRFWRRASTILTPRTDTFGAGAVFDALHGGSPASYALRFAAGFDGMLMVLSGMSSLEQVKDNASFMADFKPLNETELAAVQRVQEIFKSKHLIPCPSCRYCTDGCPQHLPIRSLLEDVAKKFEKESS